jgi:hypothetical protein
MTMAFKSFFTFNLKIISYENSGLLYARFSSQLQNI